MLSKPLPAIASVDASWEEARDPVERALHDGIRVRQKDGSLQVGRRLVDSTAFYHFHHR